MNKILDFKFNIDPQQIKDYIKNESQLNNIDFSLIIELEKQLTKLLSENVLTISCYLDDEDNTVSVQPTLFNDKVIIENKGILLTNNFIED